MTSSCIVLPSHTRDAQDIVSRMVIVAWQQAARPSRFKILAYQHSFHLKESIIDTEWNAMVL